MRTRLQIAGDAAEEHVAAALIAQGWTVVGRQVHVGRAELDIVAIDPGPPEELVIVEVRWRRRRDFGLAEDTVDRRKRARLHQGAFRWAAGAAARRLPLRFDLVVVEPAPGGAGEAVVRHYRAAF